MKYEPLKGKILLWNQATGDILTTDGKYFLETKTEDARFFRIFLKKDVKSAVQGFIKEVKFYTDEDGDCLLPTDEIIELVKKWFADVTDKKEERR